MRRSRSGTTTLALLVEDLEPAALVAELERFAGARLVYANLDPMWLDRMRAALGEAAVPAGAAPPAGDDAAPASASPEDAPPPGDERRGRRSRPDLRRAGRAAAGWRGWGGLVADVTVGAG